MTMFRVTKYIAFSCIYLTACSSGLTVEPVESTTSVVNVKEVAAGFIQKAIELENSAELNRSRQFWQLALALDPGNAVAASGLEQVKQTVSGQQQYFLHEARKRVGRGEYQKSVAFYLSALALTPGNEQIASELIEAERKNALGALAQGPRKVRLNDRSDLDADSTEEKFELALTLISTDSRRARALFQEVLKQDPGHLGARAYLEVLAD
ncbi:MAG: hypothetical protein AB8G18_13560 [Gammaproteobacteria bacterium]